MRILLDGVQTTNKGAELMLYAILQEIERKYPKAEVFISKDRIHQGLDYVKTGLSLKYINGESIENSLHLGAIYRNLHISYRLMPHVLGLRHLDYYLDGSGFKFSDQFKLTSKHAAILNNRLSAYREIGAKIIFLPQAFGPFERAETREVMAAISRNSSIIMPREKTSYDYLKQSQVVDMNKVKMFTDFTSLVEGVFPTKYENLKGGICIIPNMKMINKGAISLNEYIELLKSVIVLAEQSGKKVYLLNHEGDEDEKLCRLIQEQTPIDVVTKLNALEIKGLLKSAYLVISSRFHGVASTLNSCVPCLATSWSHKYKELFNDYKQSDCLLPLNDIRCALDQVSSFMDPKRNMEVRKQLSSVVPQIKEETRRMWDVVWS